MSLFQVLNCSGDVTSCCSDIGLARLLSIMQNMLNLMHLVVPIILMVMATIQFIKMMINPDEKKNTKSLINKFLAAVFVFFVPTFMNVILNYMPGNFEIYACWDAASKTDEIISASKVTYISPKDAKEPTKVIVDPDSYEKGQPKEDGGSGGGNGTILLIAGHSYPTYCSNYPNDCRGREASGYDETEETRKLVKLIKKELDSLNVKADIANALMAGDTDRMNKSFYRECKNNTRLCRKYKWKKYEYVLEIHFNGCAEHTASGPLLVKTSSSYSTKADKDILNAVSKHTGKKVRSAQIIPGIYDIKYFKRKGVPITYLETEFYDNKKAMDKYTKKKELIAKDIAAAIKKHYG